MLLAACGNAVVFVSADLSSMKTAKKVVQSFEKFLFDTVLFTVGITCKKEKLLSSEGIEMDTAVSFLSRFVMSQEIIARGKLRFSPSRKPRIFVMGFPGTPDVPQLDDFNWDTVPFHCWRAHKNGVIGNDALVLGLEKRHPDVNVYGLNPGVIKTEIISDFLRTTVGEGMVIFQQMVIGAICPSATDYAGGALLQLLATPHIENLTGGFFNQGGEQIKPSGWLLEAPRNKDQLWGEAEKLLGRAWTSR